MKVLDGLWGEESQALKRFSGGGIHGTVSPELSVGKGAPDLLPREGDLGACQALRTLKVTN